MQEVWVCSLLRELRSHIPYGTTKKLKKKIKKSNSPGLMQSFTRAPNKVRRVKAGFGTWQGADQDIAT